jgi:hypothetical protein
MCTVTSLASTSTSNVDAPLQSRYNREVAYLTSNLAENNLNYVSFPDVWCVWTAMTLPYERAHIEQLHYSGSCIVVVCCWQTEVLTKYVYVRVSLKTYISAF